ncbi:MAG TPA: alpha-amylase family glycosyl hydrolase [Myxococcales bacterium]
MHASLLLAGLLAAAAAVPKPARPWSDDILYFVLVDRFADGDPGNDANVDRKAKGAFHGGDLKGLLAQLDEIASLGVTAIWVNPLVKNIPGHVDGAGFPDWAYHGYWADDFTSLDPRFGTEEDLRKLVEACHARGIKVLLDVVYNHAGYDTRYLRDPKTRKWLRSTIVGDCGEDDLTSCLAGLPDFKTEQPEVAKFLLDAQIAWAKRSGIDGFRLDTVKHVDHPFWQEHRKRTRAELGPQFFLLGEVFGADAEVLEPWFEPDEMDAGFDFSFQGNVLGFVRGRGRTVAFNRYLEMRQKIRPGHLVAHYLSTHDTTGALFQLKGDIALFRLAAVLLFTTSGIPVVYYGEEVGRPGGEWPDNRSDMPWGTRDVLPGAGLPRDDALRRDYQKLIGIRKAHPALSRGNHIALSTEGNLYVFARRDAASKDLVVVAVNRGSEPATATFAAPPEWEAASVVDSLDASTPPPTRANGSLTVKLGPRQSQILVAAPR